MCIQIKPIHMSKNFTIEAALSFKNRTLLYIMARLVYISVKFGSNFNYMLKNGTPLYIQDELICMGEDFST